MLWLLLLLLQDLHLTGIQLVCLLLCSNGACCSLHHAAILRPVSWWWKHMAAAAWLVQPAAAGLS
jgi:hypothetical protein